MPRCYVQVVMGPAGSGKSTYCQALQHHAATARHTRLEVINLDPAAEVFGYEPVLDVRDLIQVEEVMEELGLGPNGALLYCMEYLLEHLSWLTDALEELFPDDDTYLIIDCPGQLELYTHVPIMRRILDQLTVQSYRMVSVFCVDAAFLNESSKFLAGSLLSLSTMIALELPHVSILTKCDLMSEESVERILEFGSATALWDLEQDQHSLLQPLVQTNETSANDGVAGQLDREAELVEKKNKETEEEKVERQRLLRLEKRRLARHGLTTAISGLLDDWQMVSFLPLNIKSEDSLEHVFMTVNHAIQYGEDLEVHGAEANEDAPEQEGHVE